MSNVRRRRDSRHVVGIDKDVGWYLGLPRLHAVSNVTDSPVDIVNVSLIVRSHVDVAKDVIEKLHGKRSVSPSTIEARLREQN